MAAISRADAAAPAHLKHALVLYDGQCALCRKSVALLRGLDWFNVLGFVDVRDSEQLGRLHVPVPPGRLLEEMHVVPPNGEIRHGFGAFRWLAWRLPLMWFLLPLLYIPGAGKMGQRAYLWVARHRFRLVPCHGGVCSVPRRPGG
jgi:predicted DCC family thiol-disulfide oxidoreductase YuxK